MEKKYFNAGEYQEEFEKESLRARIKYIMAKKDDVNGQLMSLGNEEAFVKNYFVRIFEKEHDDKIKEHPYLNNISQFSSDTTFLIDKKYPTKLVDSIAFDEFKTQDFDDYTKQYFGKLLFDIEQKFGDEKDYSLDEAANKVEEEIEKLSGFSM